MDFIKKTWRGETPLIVSYWIIGVLGNLVISFIALTLESLGTTVYGESLIFRLIALFYSVFMICYMVFSLVSIWRSAGKYIADAKTDNIITSNSPFWGYVARVMVVLGIIQVIFGLIDEFTI